MVNSDGEGMSEFSQVPADRLVYNRPSKDDYPSRTSNWRDGLNNILSAVEESEQEKTYNPIVLFRNAKYVCVYDMVSEEDIYRIATFYKLKTHDLCISAVSKSKVSSTIDAPRKCTSNRGHMSCENFE